MLYLSYWILIFLFRRYQRTTGTRNSNTAEYWTIYEEVSLESLDLDCRYYTVCCRYYRREDDSLQDLLHGALFIFHHHIPSIYFHMSYIILVNIYLDFQLSFKLWKRVMFGFWLTVIIYSMTILILVYTYQFHDFDNYWYEYLRIPKEL